MDQNESSKGIIKRNGNEPKSIGRMCQNHPKSAELSKIERTWSLK